MVVVGGISCQDPIGPPDPPQPNCDIVTMSVDILGTTVNLPYPLTLNDPNTGIPYRDDDYPTFLPIASNILNGQQPISRPSVMADAYVDNYMVIRIIADDCPNYATRMFEWDATNDGDNNPFTMDVEVPDGSDSSFRIEVDLYEICNGHVWISIDDEQGHWKYDDWPVYSTPTYPIYENYFLFEDSIRDGCF